MLIANDRDGPVVLEVCDKEIEREAVAEATPIMRAVIRGSLCAYTGGRDAVDDVLQEAEIGLITAIRSGSTKPWEIGIKAYAAGVARNQARAYIRKHSKRPMIQLGERSVIVRPGQSMENVVEVVKEAVQDDRGRLMVVQYLENPDLAVAELGRRAGITNRKTSCSVWNKALENIRSWLEENSIGA